MKTELTAEEENLKHTKPCRVDGVTPCVQIPEDDPCDCDWCVDCPVPIRSEAKDAS